jgi:hypothetical protein
MVFRYAAFRRLANLFLMLVSDPRVYRFFQVLDVIRSVNNRVDDFPDAFGRYIAYITRNADSAHFQRPFHFLQKGGHALLQFIIFPTVSA